MSTANKVLVIAGPTASGKSSYAIDQAKEHGGVVINADSMQLYDALPTLTAQPTAADRQTVPHRLYATLAPAEAASAWRWRDMALSEIKSAHDSGLLPIVTGGTGFYIKALTEGLSPIPEVPPETRRQVTARLAEMGNEAFHRLLLEHDPATAKRLHPNDSQRLIRAMEVRETTGKTLSWWQEQPLIGPPAHLEFAIQVLDPPREVLHQRCNSRFDQMLESDVLTEVAALSQMIAAGAVAKDALITKALGFQPLCAYMDGILTRAEAANKAKAQTRQYAKRQVTWFRNQIGNHAQRITPSQKR